MKHPIYYYSVLYFHNQIQYRTILFFLQNLIEYLTAFRISSYSFILYTLYVRSFRIISSSMKGSISFSNLLISYVFYGSYSSSCVSQFVCLYTYHLLGDIFLILGTSHGSKREISLWIINLMALILQVYIKCILDGVSTTPLSAICQRRSPTTFLKIPIAPFRSAFISLPDALRNRPLFMRFPI